MVAVYYGMEYKYVSNKRSKEIITSQVTKTDRSFLKDRNIYYKSVDDAELTDIYSVEFMVRYDPHLKDVPTWWKVTKADVFDNSIRIRFAYGILPDWDIEEKNVCTKHIDIKDFSEAKIIFTYKKKDGKDVDSISIEEKKEISKLIDLMNQYEESNL